MGMFPREHAKVYVRAESLARDEDNIIDNPLYQDADVGCQQAEYGGGGASKADAQVLELLDALTHEREHTAQLAEELQSTKAALQEARQAQAQATTALSLLASEKASYCAQACALQDELAQAVEAARAARVQSATLGAQLAASQDKLRVMAAEMGAKHEMLELLQSQLTDIKAVQPAVRSVLGARTARN
ncbi:hypothetical protein FOA52_012379 [Chlamydomonas sp. UWO 241]|nr:hypothetical protein FOA52_012379 [Chlamydomonas sp. UWO 241]